MAFAPLKGPLALGLTFVRIFSQGGGKHRVRGLEGLEGLCPGTHLPFPTPTGLSGTSA